MKFKIHKSIAEIDQARWDAIVDKNYILSSHRYMSALEKSGVNKDRCYYLVGYEGDEIVAHACAYLIHEEVDIFAGEAISRVVKAVRKKWKSFLMMKSLECGSPICAGSAIQFKPGIDRAAALRSLCAEMQRLANELGAKFVLFRDFYDHEKEMCAVFEKDGYKKIHNLPQAFITIKWKSFNEYLNSMRSNYRCKITKNMDKCAKAGVSIQIIRNPSEWNTSDLKRLYDNVYDNATEVKRERLPGSIFENIGKHLSGEVVIVTAAKDGKLIGYMMLLLSGDTLITKFPGIDYSCNKDCCTYFNVFYKSLELAIESGLKKVDMGITTLNPKRDMGSEIFALNMYMKHSNPILNRIIPAVFDFMTPPDTTVPRDVFK